MVSVSLNTVWADCIKVFRELSGCHEQNMNTSVNLAFKHGLYNNIFINLSNLMERVGFGIQGRNIENIYTQFGATLCQVSQLHTSEVIFYNINCLHGYINQSERQFILSTPHCAYFHRNPKPQTFVHTHTIFYAIFLPVMAMVQRHALRCVCHKDSIIWQQDDTKGEKVVARDSNTSYIIYRRRYPVLCRDKY